MGGNGKGVRGGRGGDGRERGRGGVELAMGKNVELGLCKEPEGKRAGEIKQW